MKLAWRRVCGFGSGSPLFVLVAPVGRLARGLRFPAGSARWRSGLFQAAALGVIASCLLSGLAAQAPSSLPQADPGTAAPHRDSARAGRRASLSAGTGLFYATPGDSSASSFRAHADRIGIIAPQSFALDQHGGLHGSLPADLNAIARQQRVPIMPLVINAGFSSRNAERLLHSPAARDQAIGALLDQARELSLQGWQIDFENLPSSQQAAFSEFVREAAQTLHRHGFELSVAVAARTSDLPDSELYRSFSGVYDYTALARSADFLSVMAYPESDARHPGPLAAYPWVEQVVQHVLLQVPPDKLSLGLPTYQTDWMQRRVRLTLRRRVRGRIRRLVRYIYRLFFHSGPVTVQSDDLHWDPVVKSSYRITGTGRSRHITWVEDERSFAAKLRLVEKYHLRGYSVWRIGLEDPDLWGQLPVVDRSRHNERRLREVSDPSPGDSLPPAPAFRKPVLGAGEP